MTLEEKKAVEYADSVEEKKHWSDEYDSNTVFTREEVEQAYIAGAKENGVVWHDLRKDPNDLPKDNGTVLVRLEKPIMKFSFFYVSEKMFSVWNKEYECNVHLHNVIAWCEIPQFKE